MLVRVHVVFFRLWLEILWSLLLLLLLVAAATWSANPLRFFVTLFSTKVLDFSTKVFRFTTKGLVFSTKEFDHKAIGKGGRCENVYFL
jgi:hypothetical protein